MPNFQQVTRPLLDEAQRAGSARLRDLEPSLAAHFGLTPAEREERIASGGSKWWNRLSWAKTYLKMAGLPAQPRRGFVSITEEGRAALRDGPATMDVPFLMRYDSFRQFQERSTPESPTGEANPAPGEAPFETPDEHLERGYAALRANLEADVLSQVKEASPAFFEKVVLDLLTRMGYGGSRPGAAKWEGRSGDGGIDGTINEDPLGLETIYVQAKRWTSGSVGRPELQAFVGALQGHGARKGVFLTTSRFHENAIQYSKQVATSRVVLINGETLARLMVDHGIGANVERSYDVKRIDNDYFAEE